MQDSNTKFKKGMGIITNNYIDLKINGRLFPSWVLANFRDYKLPEIMQTDEDPCNIRQTKFNLKQYQEFLSKYL